MEINDKIKHHLISMEKSCNDMKKIISDILDLSKIEANEISIDINECHLTNFINDLVNIHSTDYDIKYKIGLFCMESINYENLVKLIEEKFKKKILWSRMFSEMDGQQ